MDGGGAVRHALHVGLWTGSSQAKSHVGAHVRVVGEVVKTAMGLEGEVPAKKSPGMREVHGVACEQQRKGDPSPGQVCTRR